MMGPEVAKPAIERNSPTRTEYRVFFHELGDIDGVGTSYGSFA
jgi:hypothetical protein